MDIPEELADFISQLNESQREVVLYIDGPSLVIAGAGSGKTRVLTYKIAYLLQQGLSPYSIMALTFTNKAAREMKERIVALTGASLAKRLWMGTFHSIFARILRNEAKRLNYSSNFTIYDADDSKRLIKALIKEMGLDDKVYRAGMVQGRISQAKNALITATAYEQSKDLVERDTHAKVPRLKEIYHRYEQRRIQSNAMDFDDLLLQTNILFRNHRDVLDKYRNFFQYILVDEYQDTNFAQHLIVRSLSEEHQRICVVGDDAQSIYSFRGANIDNILKFQHQYPGCKVFKLERNYRSTQNIVDAANSLIHKNKEQIPKTVYSEKEKGSKLLLASSYSDYEEAHIVALKIAELRTGKTRYSYADFAVLYRTNAQSRLLEEALRKHNIPYRIYGGLSFYQRKEVKDVIAYLRLVVNPHDEEALKRVINYPTRGIGNTTVSKLTAAAATSDVSVWTALTDPLAYQVQANSSTLKKLKDFRTMMEDLIQQNASLPANEIAALAVKRSGIADEFAHDHSPEGTGRKENVEELLKGISEFIHLQMEEGAEQVSLADFLAEVSLLTDQDDDKNPNADKVTLMTVHAAKGLEFKNVFIVGLEENLFPSILSHDDARDIEEERRLFYVAITRAEENCILTYAKSRFRNGKTELCSPSRFLHDIDPQYIDAIAATFPPNTFEKATNPYVLPHKALPTQRPLPPPPPLPNEALTNLKAGDKVRHERFGTGVVIDLEDDGINTKATVEFPHFGQKRLLLKYARLTPL